VLLLKLRVERLPVGADAGIAETVVLRFISGLMQTVTPLIGLAQGKPVKSFNFRALDCAPSRYPRRRTKMEDGTKSQVKGAPPRSGWARMVVELHVNDLGISLSFWRDLLSFQTAFQRAEERFAYLEHLEGHQIMLCQRHHRSETGPLDQPPRCCGAEEDRRWHLP